MDYKFNKYQSKLDEELLSTLDSTSITELYDCLEKIEFIGNLCSTDRRRTKDLERWDKPYVYKERKPDKNGK